MRRSVDHTWRTFSRTKCTLGKYGCGQISWRLQPVGRNWLLGSDNHSNRQVGLSSARAPRGKVKRKFPAEIAGPVVGNCGLSLRKNCKENRLTFSDHRKASQVFQSKFKHAMLVVKINLARAWALFQLSVPMIVGPLNRPSDTGADALKLPRADRPVPGEPASQAPHHLP